MKLLTIRSISVKKKTFCIWSNPRFAMSLKSCLNCYMTVCRKSGEGGGDDLYPGNQHDSKQQVSINGTLLKPFKCGVPQGSCLGLL